MKLSQFEIQPSQKEKNCDSNNCFCSKILRDIIRIQILREWEL